MIPPPLNLEAKMRAFDAGADEYLKKPGDIIDIVGVVGRLINKS